MIGRPFVFWAPGPFKHFILHCLLHVLPAAVADTTRLVRGKRAKMLPATRKLNKAISSLAFFTTNQWFFACDNIDQLIEEMEPVDRQLFNFDVRTIDWEMYFIIYSQGIKRFLLKEGPPRTIEDEGVAPALRSRL
jgi:fatty acyl-CoA reductase